MWVWVPTHAVTRPSKCQPIATFSLVASACMSTSTWVVLPRNSASAASISANGERAASTNTVPERLTTPRAMPLRSTTVTPLPGLPFG